MIMKKTILSFAAVALIALVAFKPGDPESLAIGAPAPKTDLKMTGISGKDVSLNDLKKENGLLVVFSCNTCPFVVGDGGESEGWEGRYDDIKATCDKNKVGMVLVNSNEAKREKGDNLNDMKKRAKDAGFEKVDYVLDKNSELADAFGARTTPHIYLLDKNLALVYKGAIDDNVGSSKDVKEPWLQNALTNLAAGKKIDPAETKPMGCSIKRVVPQ
jgi:hypothetical protein